MPVEVGSLLKEDEDVPPALLLAQLWGRVLFKCSYGLDGKREEAACFWNSLMVPIWKVERAAQATEIKCKRPLRLEVCRLGIMTL